MLGKVKLFFGIEGLKVDLDVPDFFTNQDTYINGVLRLQSKTAQRLKKVDVRLIETYQRGRGKDKKIGEYIWGEIVLNESISIKGGEEKIIDFRLPVIPQLSDIEKLGHKSIIHKQLSKAARWINNAQSQFVIEVSAQVEGTALNPSQRKGILYKH